MKIRPLISAIIACTVSTACVASQPPIEAEFQKAIDETLLEHPELPSISVSVLSPENGINWTGYTGNLHLQGPALDQEPAYRIASVTKVFVAAAIFRLIEQGHFSLSASIADLISPNTAKQLSSDNYNLEKIQVRHLLEHSSGIYNYVDDEFGLKVLNSPAHIWTRQEQIALAMDKGEPVGNPGELFHYSDTAYIILGEIIERQTGLSLSESTSKLNKFSTINLANTYFEGASTETSLPIAHQYLAGVDMSDHDPSFDLHGGGGLISTSSELARYFRALSLGWIFDKPQTLAMALTAPNTPSTPHHPPHTPLMMMYTLGDHHCWGHGGFFGIKALYCPSIDTSFAISVNANTGGKNTGINLALERINKILINYDIR